MNYLSWAADRASRVLDSVDEQATETVKHVQTQMQHGTPVTAASLFGLQKEAAGDSSAARSDDSQRPSHAAGAASSDTTVAAAASPPFLPPASKGSPARPSRILASGSAGLHASAHSAVLPRHGKEPVGKQHSSDAQRDEEYLAILNSATPAPVTASPARASSPALRSSSPAPSSASTEPHSASGVSLPRSASASSLFSSLLQKVSPSNSPAVSSRKLSRGGGTDVPAGSAPVLAPSASFPSLVHAQASEESNALRAQVAELTSEVASLKGVWNDSRAQISKLKGLLESAKELYANKLRDAEAEAKAQADVQAKAHQREMDDLRRGLAASGAEATTHQSQVTKLKLDHARELAKQEDALRDAHAATDEERRRVRALELQVEEAAARLEQSVSAHLVQLSQLHASQLERESKAEEARLAHQATLSSVSSRAETQEDRNETYVSLIASLQRQLESSQNDIERVKSEQRMRDATRAGEEEGADNIRARMESESKAHAVATAALKARIASLTERVDELSQAQSDWRLEEASLRALVSELQVAADAPASLLEAERSAAAVRDLEGRLQSMAEHLLSKSATLERVTAEKTSLRLQLENESGRVANLEIQLRSWRDKYAALESGDRDHDGDIEHGSSSSSAFVARRSRVTAPSYGSEGARITGLHADHALAKAVGFMDSVGQQVASLLRRYPQARLSFGIYVLLIHLWVAFVFVHFMHEFGQERHSTEPTLPAGMRNGRLP